MRINHFFGWENYDQRIRSLGYGKFHREKTAINQSIKTISRRATFWYKIEFSVVAPPNMSFEQKKQKTHVKHRDFHSDIQLEVSAGCSK